MRSARAWALATASDASSQNAPSRFSAVGRERVLAGDRDRAPERARHHDRRGGGRAVAGAEHRLGDLACPARPSRRPAPARPVARTRPSAESSSPGCARRRGRRRCRRGCGGRRSVAVAVALVAHDRRGVDLEHPRAALRDGREHALRASPPRRPASRRGAALAARWPAGRPPRAWRPDRPPARPRRPGSALAVGQVDAGRDQRRGRRRRGRPSGGSTTRSGAARRPWSCQWPTCGLAVARPPHVGRGTPRTRRAPRAGSRSRARRGPSTSSRR